MKEIEQFKTVIIRNFDISLNPYRFQRNLFIEFQPDEVVLKHIAIRETGVDELTAQPLLFLRTNLIQGDRILYGWPSSSDTNNLNYNYTEITNIPFQITQPINSTYDFEIVDIDGNVLEVELGIVLTLVFIKYKK